MAKTPTQQNKSSVWTWIHVNRINIALVLFFVIVPIIFALIIYTGAYVSGTRIHFDAEVTENTDYIRDFVAPNDIDAFELVIDWAELKKPTEDALGVLSGGYYRFDIYYVPNENYELISVSITPVLKTPWTDRQIIGSPMGLTPDRSYPLTLVYNEDLPLKPLWFVNVEEPHLYLKVDYTFITASNQLTKTVYVSFPLHDLNPDIVVS